MQRPTFLQRWLDYQPNKTQTFWVTAGAVVAILIAGFGFAGWVTGETAKQRSAEAAANARHALAAAVCVEEFLAQQDASGRLAELNRAGWWDRNERIAKLGFATMPDRGQPNTVVASMCAAKLAELESPHA